MKVFVQHPAMIFILTGFTFNSAISKTGTLHIFSIAEIGNIYIT